MGWFGNRRLRGYSGADNGAAEMPDSCRTEVCHCTLQLDIVRRQDRRKTPVSVLKALRSLRHAKVQPTAARRAQPRSVVKPVLTTGACIAAMLLIVVPPLGARRNVAAHDPV
jgi:hypothetical protein